MCIFSVTFSTAKKVTEKITVAIKQFMIDYPLSFDTEGAKEKLGKRKMPKRRFRLCGGDRRPRRLRQAFEKA